MSATQSTFGAAGRNWRSTRSSATRTPGTRIVVRPRLRRTSPEMPAARISRSTRLRETRTPCAMAQLGVDPRRPVDAAVRPWIARMRSISQASVSARPTGDARRPLVVARAADAEQRQAKETGVRAFSAEMNRYTLTGSRSPSRRRPRLA